ncbi:vomeronasal type-2 receptor 1-like [Polypterus senegalus]|uniref:vomeronasal type-2 receptor 1-like n=1 Tax=Polypterus senegalus TaxID=55291 RepID=UPI001965AEDA|nr:vomeronasal type-2 receptor 1-like [Polypterus senegalus]XP_039632099.1 vomeronasal type-2 receptor 1-like [Polypterus senegalus]
MSREIWKMQHIPILSVFLILGYSLGIMGQAGLPCLLETEGDLYVLGMFEVCTYGGNDTFMYTVVTALEVALKDMEVAYSGFTVGYKLFTFCGSCFYEEYWSLFELPLLLHLTQDTLDYMLDFGNRTLKIVYNQNGLVMFEPNITTFGHTVESFFTQEKWTLVGNAYEACNNYIEFENQNSSNFCSDWTVVFNNFAKKKDVIRKKILEAPDNATLFFGNLNDFKQLLTATKNKTKPFIFCCLETLEDLALDSQILNGTILLYHELQDSYGFEEYFKVVKVNLTQSNQTYEIQGTADNLNVTVKCQNKTWDFSNDTYYLQTSLLRQTYSLIQVLYKAVNSTCLENLSRCQNWTNPLLASENNTTSPLPDYIMNAIENEYVYTAYLTAATTNHKTLTCYNISLSQNPSLCSKSCKIMERIEMIGDCCSQCQNCSEGTFSNGTDCLPLTIAHEVLIYILSPLGILLCLGSLAVFLTHIKTPIVKTSGGNIFYCYLAGLIIAFSSAFLFAVTPTKNTCLIGLPLSAMGFSVCLSSILARSCRILIAFANTAARPSKLQLHLYIIIITVGTLGEVAICLAWMLIDPLHSTYLPKGQRITNVACDCNNIYWYLISFGYLVLLCLISWVLAIKSNALPPTFSESRSISFSMLIFLAIWACTLLIIVSQNKDLQTVILGVSIVLSSWGILGCITLPKVFVILFRPERNSQQWIRHVTYEYCRHVAYKADMNLETEHSSVNTSADTVMSVTS